MYPGTIGYSGLTGCALTGSLSTTTQYGPKFGKGDVSAFDFPEFLDL